jgi:hypothetical protein
MTQVLAYLLFKKWMIDILFEHRFKSPSLSQTHFKCNGTFPKLKSRRFKLFILSQEISMTVSKPRVKKFNNPGDPSMIPSFLLCKQ